MTAMAVALAAVGSNELRGSGHAGVVLTLQQQACNRRGLGTYVGKIGTATHDGTLRSLFVTAHTLHACHEHGQGYRACSSIIWSVISSRCKNENRCCNYLLCCHIFNSILSIIF